MWPKIELRWSMPVPPTVNDAPSKREDETTKAGGATNVPPIIRDDDDGTDAMDLHLTISFEPERPAKVVADVEDEPAPGRPRRQQREG